MYLIENKLPKTNTKFDRIQTKTSFMRMLRRIQRDTSEPNGNLKNQLYKVGLIWWHTSAPYMQDELCPHAT